MRTLRIVFMGTPEFAVATLDRLVTSGHTVVGVVTAPDKPAGRGRKLQMPAVKTYALGQGLPVLQPANLKDPGFRAATEGVGRQPAGGGGIPDAAPGGLADAGVWDL